MKCDIPQMDYNQVAAKADEHFLTHNGHDL